MRAASGVHTRETGSDGPPPLDVERIRADFPILSQRPHGKPLVYLDNAATTQKPQPVIDALVQYYTESNANIHRGVHYLSEKATAAYEGTRVKAAEFIGAAAADEIVFLRGTTEGINLVMYAFCRKRLQPGDEILITGMEHHSNIVPWQMLSKETGALLRVVPLNDRGEAELEAYGNLLGPKTRFVAVTQVSNALGSVNPVREMVEMAHRSGVPVLVDGAQAVAHTDVNVQALDCDFYAFSGHKLYGPTGAGVLYGKREHLESMDPFQGGGEMIASVTFEKTTYNRVPYKFEAGTPNIAGTIAMGKALDYVQDVGLARIATHENELLEYATEQVGALPEVRIIGEARNKTSILSFVLDGIHPHDAGTILDREGIAIRAGHHCAQPVMERFGVTATVRASFAFYNTREEVDTLVEGLRKAIEVFG